MIIARASARRQARSGHPTPKVRICQLVTIAIIVSAAATIGVSNPGASLNSVGDIAASFTPFLGHTNATILFGLGMAGASVLAALVLVAPNLVDLSVDIEVMNACLLPVVLGFLLALERRALPPPMRMRGTRRVVTSVITLLVIALGLYTAAQTLFG